MFGLISLQKKKCMSGGDDCMLFKCSFHIDFLLENEVPCETTLSFMADLWQLKKKKKKTH